MKIKILSSDLKQAIQCVERAVPSTSTMPLLTGICIKTTQNCLVLTGNNIDLGIKYTIPAEIENEGELVLPGEYFCEIVRKLTSEYVKIEKDSTKDRIKIQGGSAIFNLNYMNPQDYPSVPHKETELSYNLSTSIFKILVTQVAFSAGKSENQRYLSGVCFDFNNLTLTAVATNTFRLSLKKVKLEEEVDKNVEEQILIPSKNLIELSRIIPDEEPLLTISPSKTRVYVECGNIYAVSRLIDEDYIKYSKLIPSDFPTTVTLDRNEFLDACRRVDLLTEKLNAVKVDIKGSTCCLSANRADVGSAYEELLVTKDGDDIKLVLDVRYLMDVLKVIETKNIQLKLIDNERPVMVVPEDDDSYEHILMPVNLRDN